MTAQVAVILALLLLAPHASWQQQQQQDGIMDSALRRDYPHGQSELVFLLDRSGSIGADEFDVQLFFVKSLMTEFSIGPDATRVAIVSYSEDVTRHVDYITSEQGNKCAFLSAIKDVKYTDGSSTDTARALDEARDILVHSRPDVKRVVILLSDGISNTGSNPMEVADQLKADGVEVFAIGVGLLDRTQLERIASTGDHYFTYHSFDDFKRLALRVRGDPHETMYDDSVNQTLCDSLCHQPFPGASSSGCCDLTARCTCSLVGGRHACVCGPGTYGRNGFLYQCKLCPRGTYKSTYEPTDGCPPCPPDSTTAAEGSKLLGACFCKEGYEGDPMRGEPCRLVTCPSLKSPSISNGRISPAACSNKYQSVCSFQCDVGYQLEDSDSAKRRCQANGHWTETTPQCRKVQCAALSKPSNGLISCQNQEAGNLNVYATICSFSCSDGYHPVGSRERTCTASGEWFGDDFACRPITCPLLSPLRYGSIQPAKCATTKRRVKFTCIFKCKDGFRREGPDYRMCEASGNWSKPGEEVVCIDNVPPEITCPDSVVKNADPGLSSADVSWDMPIIQDNLDGTDALTLTVSPPGMKSPHRFEIGSLVISYTVTDRAGLSSICLFKVVVQDTQPPTVESCPEPIIDITSAKKTIAVTWDEPQFADNSKQDLQIVKSHEQGAKLTWGTHIVTYTATDSAGASAECRFTIRLGPSSCPNYPDPRNGARACDQWLFGQFCRVFCNEAFEFAAKPATWYLCSGSAWKTQPSGLEIPWPDCSERAPAQGVRRGMSSQYYAGDCVNEKTQRAIKAAFIEDFKKKFKGIGGICGADNHCKVEYVTVYCGEIDDDVRRRRRRAAGPGDETDFANVVTLDFTVSTRIRSVDKTQHDNQLANAVRTLDEISTGYERLAKAGQLRLVVDNQTLPVVEDSVTVDQSVLLCRNGSVALDGTDCISCAVGSYLDSNRQSCRACAEGTYQDEEGRDHCKPCPGGTWTEGPQAKDVSECRPECRPGTYSPSGLATCRPCLRGSFQPGFKQTACLPCRDGTTTPAKGSRSGSDCQAVCGPGTFSATGLVPCHSCSLGSYQPAEQQIRCVLCDGSKTTAVDGAISGEECIEINACESAPCQNAAQCTSDRGVFHCQCLTGFAGTTCEVDIDECLSQPCLFNSTCIDHVGGFDCLCLPGYKGVFCGSEINECLSNPCQNEAKCQDQVAGFDCDCIDGFWGPLCENRPDPCAGQACLNEGFCILTRTPASFQCVCQSGYQGLRCETDVNECDLRPCQNGGSCGNTPGSYQCACVPGFEGTHCEVDVDDCVHHSCANGSTCSDVIAGYQCLCPPGIAGQFCETEMLQDFLLNFSSSLTSDFSLVRTRHLEFHEITLSVWLRTTDATNMGTPISYAAMRPANHLSVSGTGSRLLDNALTVTDCSSLRIYVNGLVIFTDVAINDGRWNSLVFTWSEAAGEWHLYLNGTELANGTGLTTEAVPGQGAFVLGQEQDAIGGAFSSREAYLGEIYKLNIWDRVLPKDDIQNLSHRCHQEKGNVVAWSDFLAGLEGGLLEPKPTNTTVELSGCESY